VSGSKQVNIEFEKISSIFNSSLSSKIIDNTITLFNEPTVITNKEMLEGSPASQKLNEQSDFLETSTAATKAINFNSVARVHYLDSYDSLNGVGKQNWKLLTEQKYNDVQQKSQALVCKLVKVSDAIGTNDILDVEPMSSLFVLGSPEVRHR
jgi:viroplasmin and RNaseH domain-containing protein